MRAVCSGTDGIGCCGWSDMAKPPEITAPTPLSTPPSHPFANGIGSFLGQSKLFFLVRYGRHASQHRHASRVSAILRRSRLAQPPERGCLDGRGTERAKLCCLLVSGGVGIIAAVLTAKLRKSFCRHGQRRSRLNTARKLPRPSETLWPPER